MKLTITNNGTDSFSVKYRDMYKLYDQIEGEPEGDTVVLHPDTSVTLDNVEDIYEISSIEDTDGVKDDADFSLDGLDLEDDEENDEDDFDVNELDSDRTPL